jgi:hypothetical protein
MLFLGAGASKAVGIPTMKEFTSAILKDIERRGGNFQPLIASLQEGISKMGIEPDIEAVLTVLDGKANPRKNLDNLAAQQIPFPKEFQNVSEKDMAWVAMSEIEDSIYNICSSIIPQLATKTYAGLWDALNATIMVPYGVGGGARTTLIGGSLNKRIFTTNYDLSMEIFLKTRKIEYEEGFRQVGGDIIFANEWAYDQYGEVQLAKLHGSINYYLMENGRVVKSNAQLKHTDIYGDRVREQMMIYPMGEKYATRLPFYETLGQLRSALFTESLCITIGYSFRDVAINNAFLDAIRVNSKLQMILVSPSADRVRGTLDPSLQERTHAINGALGNELLPQGITEQVMAWYPPV